MAQRFIIAIFVKKLKVIGSISYSHIVPVSPSAFTGFILICEIFSYILVYDTVLGIWQRLDVEHYFLGSFSFHEYLVFYWFIYKPIYRG